MARDVWKALAKVDGFAEGSSIFSDDDADVAYFVNGTQVANMTPDGLELRLTRKVISAHRHRFKEDPSVILRRSGSDWLGVKLDADLALVLELAGLAAEAHRPPPGVTAKPPPTGADLARRRKFH